MDLSAANLSPRGWAGRQRLGALFVVILTALSSLPGGPVQSATPVALVETLDDTLLQAMREAKALGYQGRYDLLAPVLNEVFDYAFMARVTVGRHWRDLDENQRALLVDTFSRLSAATFASRFNGFDGERFEITGEEPRPRETMLVQNALIKADGTKVSIDILLRTQKEDWRAIDVYLDGTYSELAIKRSEYTSVIEREGFEALISAMEARIDEQARAAQK